MSTGADLVSTLKAKTGKYELYKPIKEIGCEDARIIFEIVILSNIWVVF
jgi:hypothetical protein